MGLIANIEAETRAAYQNIGHPRDPVVAEWLNGGINSNTGLSVTADSAMRTTVVYRAVSILSQTYASMPLSVDRFRPDGGVEEDKSHPLYDIIVYQPNKWQTSFEWREMMAAHFALRGRCYSEIVSSGGKAVAELIPLHPDRITPFRAPDGKIAFHYQPNTGAGRIILQDEMHWMHLMTSDGLDWKSPIQLCRESVGLAQATEEHAGRLFGNGTRPSGFLKMPGHFKDDVTAKNFSKSWKANHAGLKNTGDVIVLEDGLEWQSVGMTQEDAQFIELRSFQLAEIGPRIFGVPSHKLGDLSRSTNNNIEHQGIEFVTDTIRPGVVRWEQAMQRDLIFGKRTHCVNFDMDGLMRGDSAATAAKNSSDLQNGIKNRNQVRVQEGLNPVDDDSMNAYTVQSNMIDVKDMGKFMNPKQTELPK